MIGHESKNYGHYVVFRSLGDQGLRKQQSYRLWVRMYTISVLIFEVVDSCLPFYALGYKKARIPPNNWHMPVK